MAKMKTPKKKEVVKYFENAKEVECLTDKETYDISKYEFTISKFQDDWWLDTPKDCDTNIHLFDDEKGYAKILSYKEPKEETYKITKEQIYKLFNTYGNDKNDLLKKYFSEVFETKLTVGKWYKLETNKTLAFITELLEKKDVKACGFNFEGYWVNEKNDWTFNIDAWTEATTQEVTEALTKEAVRRGYNTDRPTHFNYKKGTGYLQNPSKSDFLFRDGILYLWDIKIFEDGQWTEIIPTLTIQEAEAKLKELGVNAKIV